MSRSGTRRRSSSRERTRESDKYDRKRHRDDWKIDERSLSRTDRETRKSSSSSTSRREESDQDFYFSNYKHELNKIFTANSNLIHDVVDFWKFVEKYESVKKRLGDSEESAADSSLNSIGVPEKYHKSHCLNFKLNLSYGELFARVPEVKQLTKSRLLKFRDVIVLYLDFKQKEKLSKLRKLRDTQANLPVARYKDEIIEMVKKEKVVIIAGDTGCGKSTQVPRYLYEAGFRKIGIILSMFKYILYLSDYIFNMI